MISSLAWLVCGWRQVGYATTTTQLDYGVEWVAVGDVNGDGHRDVVAMTDDCDGDETWKIVALRGQGNGTFSAPQVRTLALDDYQHVISGFALGDIDYDGQLDAVWLDQYAPFDKIQRNLGNGDGTFDTKTGWNVAAQYPDSLVLFARDTDNYLDAVYVTEGITGTDTLVQRCGTSTGGFDAEVTANGGTPAFVRMDFADGDTHRDYIIVQVGANPAIRTILGSDSCMSISSSYTDSTTGITNEPASDMAVGDVNGDGKKDVVILTLNKVWVATGNNTGAFNTATATTLEGDEQALLLVDIDTDGDLDLLTTDSAHPDTDYAEVGHVVVRLNNGSGSWGSPTIYTVHPSPTNLAVGDFNGDSVKDIVVGSRSFGTVTVIER
jgi:hypothetical protein